MGVEIKENIKKVLASAGGGKTTRLSTEFISILKNNPYSLRNILAITFTNKAANEMKKRILENLKEEAIQKKDKLAEILVDNIINNFSDFSIKTIDSFIHSMIRAFQYELGLNLETEVKLDVERYYEIAFERLMELSLEDEKIKEIFIKYADYYFEDAKGLRFWENMYEKLKKMLKDIFDKEIKLRGFDRADDLTSVSNFTYCLHNLINKYIGCINEIEKEENIILIERFGDYIRRLFDIYQDIPFIYYKIGSRFRHILIDEFQDTSIVQWNNIEPIVHNIISEGGTFFYVGDPKQSIYQWRGGTPALFEEVKEKFKNYGVKEENLDINYRSREIIVKFVMDIFNIENIKDIKNNIKDKDISESIFEEFELHIQHFENVEQKIRDDKKDSGYVVIKKKNESEIENSIVEELKEINKRRNYSDIAILVRTNKQVSDIVKILSMNGIPYYTRENLDVFENEIVREIISFLKFINTPNDNLSFFNFITGKCFLKVSGIEKDFIIEKFLDCKDKYFYSYFQKIFEKEWEKFIKPYFNRFGYIPLYELIIEFIRDYKIYENFKNEIGFVEAFLEYIYKIKDYGNDISTIIEKINEEKVKINQGIYENAVTVSTVHSVKGLEFPVVFLPYLEYTLDQKYIPKEFFIGENDKIFVRFKDENEKNKEETECLKTEENIYKETIKNEYYKNAVRILSEEINLLYVALTRAKDELYIYYTTAEKNEIKLTYKGLGKLWNLIINKYMSEKGEELKIGDPITKKSEEKGVEYFYPERKSGYDDMIKSIVIKKKETFIEEEKIGEAFHKVLGNVYNINEEDIFNELEYVVNCMFPKNKREYYKEKIKALLKSLIEWQEIKEILMGDEILLEKWGCDEDGMLRIDRIIFDGDNIRIIDFKTGKENTEDKKQIERYKRFIKSVHKDKKIKGFLIYVLDRKIEEV